MRHRITCSLRIALLTLLLGILPLLALGQSGPAATISGTVLDAEMDRPLPGANVVLRGVDEGQRYGSAADSTGSFAFGDMAPGEYRLVVTFIGYERHAERVSLSAGDAAEHTVRLESAALPEGEVMITAMRARSQLNPVTTSNLTARDIDERRGVKDVPSLLSELPSTTFHSQNGHGIGYSTLSIRGFDQRRLAVSINGIPQNDPESFNVFWVNLYGLEPSIKDIQVQRGAGSAVYGSVGIGGAINIVADPYDVEPYLSLRTGAGSFNTRRRSVEANSGLLGERYVTHTRFTRVQSDGYREHAWIEFNRFFGGVTRYGDRSRLTLQAFGGIQQDGLAFQGIPRSANGDPEARRQNPSVVSQDVERFHPPQVHLLHDWNFAPNWTLDQSLFWIKGEGYFDYGAAFRSADFLNLPEDFALNGEALSGDERQLPLLMLGLGPDDVKLRGTVDQNQVGWIPTLQYRDGTTETTVGLEARLHRSLSWGRIQEAGGMIPHEVVGAEADRRLWQYRGEKAIGSVFGSHLFRAVERLAVQGDLQLTWRRYRIYDEKHFGRSFATRYLFANPRVGVMLNPDRPLSAYASLAFAQREPQLSQLYDASDARAGEEPQFERRADGSFDYDAPLVQPESLVNLELGGGVRQAGRRLSANLFWMEFWDEVVPSGTVDQFGRPRTGNADRSRHVGLEVEGAAQVLPGWEVSGNAMVARTRFVDFAEYRSVDGETVALERDGNPIAASPEQLVNLRTSYRVGGLRGALSLQGVGRQYVDNSGGTRPGGTEAADRLVDPYALLGASISYAAPERSPFRGLHLNLKVNNVLNSKVLQYGFQGVMGPEFYPAATRHVFLELRYTLR